MKALFYALLAINIAGCSSSQSSSHEAALNINDTWLLLDGTIIQESDTSVTDYTKDQKMIKIINDNHFAFIKHDLTKGQDSTNRTFSAGAGQYTLTGNRYKESLEFCSYREWEGHDFEFDLSLNADTLIQQGREHIADLGVDRIIIERYVRMR